MKIKKCYLSKDFEYYFKILVDVFSNWSKSPSL